MGGMPMSSAPIASGSGMTPQPTQMGAPSSIAPKTVVSACNPSGINPSRYAVNVPGMMEQISQPLYDIQSYPVAGITQMTFFQTPFGGQLAGVNRTLADTNMRAAGALPQPQQFLVQAIQVEWYPGQTSAPFQYLGAAVATGQVEDFANVFNGKGYLSMSIGSKTYLEAGPLITLPPRSVLGIDAAASNSTTLAAGQSLQIVSAYARGPLWHVNPMLIPPMQNWAVTLNWPAAIGLTADTLARIGVRLWGMLFRPIQ
jgi:hypothetical protein